MSRNFAITGLAAVFVFSALWTSAASAQTDAARALARQHFTAAVDHYEAERYERALQEFQEAYRIAPHPTVRVNIANCYEQMDRPLEALHYFERFLAESEGGSRRQRREVRTAIRRLEGRIGSVTLAVVPDGTTVVIDDSETRRSPVLEPIRLRAGTHRFVFRREGHRTETRQVEVSGGAEQNVSVRLQSGAAAVAVAATPPPRREPEPEPVVEEEPEEASETTDVVSALGEPDAEPLEDEDTTESLATDEPPPSDTDEGDGWRFRLTMPVVISGATTGGLMVGSIVTGAVALAANADFENAVTRYENATSELSRIQAQQDGRSAADLANTMSIVSDVFTIATVAAAGATAFFLVIDGMDETNEDLLADEVRVRAVPVATTTGGGVSLAGQF